MKKRLQKKPGKYRYEITCGEFYIGTYRGDTEQEAIDDCLNAFDKIASFGRVPVIPFSRDELEHGANAEKLERFDICCGEENVNSFYAKNQSEAVQKFIAQFNTSDMPADELRQKRDEILDKIEIVGERQRQQQNQHINSSNIINQDVV